jgi:WD40 repeat protein
MEKPLHVFCCYARTDQSYLLELNKRLVPLQREGLIVVHADINISPGEDWEQKIHHYLDTAHVILLLVSSDFIASEYCYSNEMMRALERHNAGEARVIPIILRPVDLRRVPFGKIQSLPTDVKPVTRWADQDDAFLDVVNGIEEVVEYLLQPAVGTTLLTYEQIGGAARTIAWSLDGARLASGRGGAIHVWGATTGKIILKLRAPFEGVRNVTWLPGERLFALGVKGTTVQVWDATSGSQFPSYQGHSKDILTVVCSPDGRLLASGSRDNTVQVWDATSGKQLLCYEGHSKWIRTVAWSPDGRLLASSSADNTVQVWDATSGKQLLRYEGHSDLVTTVVWSPDGRLLASGGYDKTVQVWDATSGKQLLR